MPRGEDGVLGERECFVPRPGFVFCDNDYDGLELRTMSQMMIDNFGKSIMGPLLNQGLDVHLDFGAWLMLGLSYEQALARKKDPDVKGARQVAKPCNFGLGGGMGAVRLGATAKKDYGIVRPLPFWQNAHSRWRERWQMHPHFAWAQAMTRNGGRARVKQLRVDRWRGGMGYCDTSNAPFQGLGSDAAKDALFEVVRACYDATRQSPLYGSRVVNFVHDQIITEVPISGAHECAMAQTALMIEAANRYLPDVPATTTPSLCRRMSKGATTLYDAHGRLLVWEHPALEGKAA